jgi:hypothetical protein
VSRDKDSRQRAKADAKARRKSEARARSLEGTEPFAPPNRPINDWPETVLSAYDTARLHNVQPAEWRAIRQRERQRV